MKIPADTTKKLPLHHWIIAVGNNAQFDKFCRQVIERPDIVEDPRFATNVERAKNRLVLGPMLKELIAGFARDVLLQRMTAAGIPCGKVAGSRSASWARSPARPARWARTSTDVRAGRAP